MNTGSTGDNTTLDEHEALLSFMYMCPVGIVRSDLRGEVDMLNPLAAQLLMPLARHGELHNIFESLSGVAPELRNLVDAYQGKNGPICENLRIYVTPVQERAVVLTCTLMQVRDNMLMMVLTDISEQAEIERRARQNESWLASLYTSVNDFAFLTLDAGGTIDSWNASVARLTGYSHSDVIGKTLLLFHAPDNTEKYRPPEHVARTRHEGWHIEECWCLSKTGRRFCAQMLVAVLREDDGAVSGYSVVLRDVSERRISTDDLTRLLTTDHLTGATNRGHFFHLAEDAMTRARLRSHPLSFVMMDADHFKRINDTAGHQIGDEVLRRIVDETRRVLRPADAIVRLGGEEFGVLLPGTDAEGAGVIAERIRSTIEAMRIATMEGERHITVSIGYASLSDTVASIKDLMNVADRSLYAAKKAGRNRVRGIGQAR
ncbi:diguanylate cyclase [Robbsia sp. Bb-Pol-6]|uniref:Diguanylate cyclase n=1 Tax=Robbsia betulipollinis TaxID=2981849 RepID=A0ABT3ZIV6_9BURK|nr:diguanylate cyclase [Robbsia betulipollinis]MCY0386250.1 diguanylate cyclase [Robbsia betulipollinis]